MGKRLLVFWSTALLTCLSWASVERVDNFRLIDHRGRIHELFRYSDAKAVVLITHGVGCPIVRKQIPTLRALSDEFQSAPVVFLFINANVQDDRESLAQEAEEYRIPFPILQDSSQAIVRALECDRTGEAIVVVPGDKWRIVYRGAIDDRFSYGAERAEPQHMWLKDALRAVVDGKPIRTPKTEARGCLITYHYPESPDYARDVVPILEQKCVPCHHSGGIGPFAMNGYKRVRGWGSMIREVVRTRQMPPWHADPNGLPFSNDISLSAEQQAILLRWVEKGCPKTTDTKDPLPAVEKRYAEEKPEWAFGKPDLVLQLPEPQVLPEKGVFEYRYLYVPTNLTENKWVRAIEVQPTNRAVLHHALIFVIYPPEYRHMQPEAREGLSGFFAAYAPGARPVAFPEGTAAFLPAGAVIVFQMHYTATGKTETDQTRLALYFADQAPREVLHVEAAFTTDLNIPPRTEEWATEASYSFTTPARIYGLSPHMHYRGSYFNYTLERAQGERTLLLNVPWYQFDWQPMYMFAEPIDVTVGDVIHCRGAYDNSEKNPRNPNPNEYVSFGEQSWEEMFIGYIMYGVPYKPEDFAAKAAKRNALPLDAPEPKPEEFLPGTSWRIMHDAVLKFEADGVLKVNDVVPGRWKVAGRNVSAEIPGHSVVLYFHRGELFFHTRALRRLD